VVDTKLVQGTHQDAAEVTPTRAYRAAVTGAPKVALLAPDGCGDQSASEQRGAVAAVGTLVRIHCGIEMALVERELTLAGFEVYSWRAVDDMVKHEPDMTPSKAAHRLGADLIFEINSLERSVGTVNQDARWERRFFESSESAMRGGPAMVSSDRAQMFEQLAKSTEKDLLAVHHPAVTIDVTVVSVATGQPIWFYHWSKLEDVSSATNASLAIACGEARCWLTAPAANKPSAPRSNQLRAGDIEAISVEGGPANRDATIYFGLARTVVKDLVARFASAKGPSAPTETAPAPGPTTAAVSSPSQPAAPQLSETSH
jgi:hypothetical protein